jgi:putative flavoprotein involved in K+ transport
VLSVGNPVGRRLRPKLLTAAAPLARVRRRDLDAAGVERVPRTAGTRDGLPLLEDGRALEVANVVWCTGFRYDFGWIDLPVLDDDGRPRHDRGVVADQPGLYFVGLFFQTSITSALLGGVGSDAGHVAAKLAS